MRPINLIVIHCSATRSDRRFSVEDLIACHDARFGFTGYHYYITRDGQVYQTRHENLPGAHARHYNQHSIGICLPTPAPRPRRPPSGTCFSRSRSTTPMPASSGTVSCLMSPRPVPASSPPRSMPTSSPTTPLSNPQTHHPHHHKKKPWHAVKRAKVSFFLKLSEYILVS